MSKSNLDVRSLVVCALVALLALLAPPAFADELDFAEFQLNRASGPDTYELAVRLPSVRVPEESVDLPGQCELVSSNGQSVAGQVYLNIVFACPDGLSSGDVLTAPWGTDGGVFRSSIGGRDASFTTMLHGSEQGVVVPIGDLEMPVRSFAEVAMEFTWQGIVHILEGLDHLAFILCLCLLARGGLLLLLVTAFTVGHSISLALAYLGVIDVPVLPMEATIALSIAFMAREAWLARTRDPDSVKRGRWRYVTVVVVFGLLHGLGFASVLGELGVSARERIVGLVFFNVGVEIGQLMFVAVILMLTWVLRRLRVESFATAAALLLVGALGMFWTFERVGAYLA